jgi:hypothetical protein
MGGGVVLQTSDQTNHAVKGNKAHLTPEE